MLFTLLDLRVSSLRRGHANILCIVPILTDDPRSESLESAEMSIRKSSKLGAHIPEHSRALESAEMLVRKNSK